MRSSSFLVAALAAASSLVSAEERPRIYFPRHVKRTYVNATITREAPHPPPEPTPFALTGPPTTKRQSLSDFIPTFPDPFSQGTSSSSSSTSSEDPSVTTVVIASTIVVPPSTETPSTGSSETSGSSGTTGGSASTGTVPDVIIFPTTKPDSSVPSSGSSSESRSTNSAGSASSGTSSSSGILLAPTGVVTPSSSKDPVAPISSLLSSVVSQITSAVAPTQNSTDPTPTVILSEKPTGTVKPSDPTSPPGLSISLSLPLTEPTTPPVQNVTSASITIIIPPTVTGTGVPSVNITTEVPPPPTGTGSTVVTTPPPPSSSVPPTTQLPASNSTEPPATSIPPAPTTTPVPPTYTPPIVNGTEPTTNATAPPVPSTSSLTSLPPSSQTWLPTTILVQPTQNTPNPTGLAPTTTSGLPTGLPKAITPDTANGPMPDDTMEIQVAFNFGLNYKFVASTPKAAAIVLTTMPFLLSYQGGFPHDKTVVRRLVPYDTSEQLGYVTMLAICTYPISLVDQLRMDMHIPTAPIWNSPDMLAYNMSQQINTAIDILIGSTLDWSPSGTGGGSSATSTSGPNDVFNPDGGSDQSPSQRGMTAGIAVGAIFVSAAYGTAMFIIARRYKRKKQSHHRSSSITSPSEMRQTGSPALMGGALLSRDFTSSYGGVAGGRDSHGSGRSGMNNSARTAYISAPVAAENSLGWN